MAKAVPEHRGMREEQVNWEWRRKKYVKKGKVDGKVGGGTTCKPQASWSIAQCLIWDLCKVTPKVKWQHTPPWGEETCSRHTEHVVGHTDTCQGTWNNSDLEKMLICTQSLFWGGLGFHPVLWSGYKARELRWLADPWYLHPLSWVLLMNFLSHYILPHPLFLWLSSENQGQDFHTSMLKIRS